MPRRAMPRVVVIAEHQDPTDVASLNRTEPRTPRSATCCSVALGSAGACDPCNARAAHAVHACAANRYPSKHESHPEPRQLPLDCGGAWCPLGDGVLVSAAFFCGVRGRLLALHPPKCSTSGPPPPAPRHVHETTTRHGETARDRELGVGVSARADPSDRTNCACSGSDCGGGGRVHHPTRRGLHARARLRRWQR